MAEDTYANLAERYDWMKETNPAREQFFRRLFRKHAVRKILDCACGTGHELILFHSMGCEVFGSDLSESMLTQARGNLAEANIDAPLQQADFCRLPEYYDTEFDAVVCLTNAINEVLEDTQTLQALRSMRSLLRSRGILVFDQGQTDAGMRNPQRFCPIINKPDATRFLVTDYVGDTATVNIFDFVHTRDTSDFKHTAVRIRIRLQDSWKQILGDAGFKKVEFFGDLDFAPYDKKSSRRLIVVAER